MVASRDGGSKVQAVQKVRLFVDHHPVVRAIIAISISALIAWLSWLSAWAVANRERIVITEQEVKAAVSSVGEVKRDVGEVKQSISSINNNIMLLREDQIRFFTRHDPKWADESKNNRR